MRNFIQRLAQSERRRSTELAVRWLVVTDRSGHFRLGYLRADGQREDPKHLNTASRSVEHNLVSSRTIPAKPVRMRRPELRGDNAEFLRALMESSSLPHRRVSSGVWIEME